MVCWDRFNAPLRGVVHSFTIIELVLPGTTVMEICHEWALNMCQPHYQPHHPPITERLNLITCPFLALIGFPRQDFFKPPELRLYHCAYTLANMHLRSACCCCCKYLSSQDFLCFKQMRSFHSERLAKQTESLMVWFKLQHQWKFMRLLVSLVMSTSNKYLMDISISEKHCLVGRRSCRVARSVCKEHQTRSWPKCMRLNAGRHYKPNAKNGPSFLVVSLVIKWRAQKKACPRSPFDFMQSCEQTIYFKVHIVHLSFKYKCSLPHSCSATSLDWGETLSERHAIVLLAFKQRNNAAPALGDPGHLKLKTFDLQKAPALFSELAVLIAIIHLP